MILIPEIETVVILVPRTGSKSLRQAILERYPRAMPLYRHMEADGVPLHYTRWRKIGVLRHPVDRMWSLYNYCKTVKAEFSEEHAARLQSSTRNLEFNEWLVYNTHPFCDPWAHESGFSAYYSCIHVKPENKKSQAVYLRPDLGTEIFSFNHLNLLKAELDIKLPHINGRSSATGETYPPLDVLAQNHVTNYFHWDLLTLTQLHDNGGKLP